jgi:hypothetical protein
MSQSLDAEILIRMTAVAVQGIPRDWVAIGPILGALIDMADLPICAAPDPDAARTLMALGARLAPAPQPEAPPIAGIDLLVLKDRSEFTPEWRPFLAPGALVIVRGCEAPILGEDDALTALLDFEDGISLDLRAGGRNTRLRLLVEALGHRPELSDAIIWMAEILQSKHAHLELAGRASSWIDDQALAGADEADPEELARFRPNAGSSAQATERAGPWHRRLLRYLGLVRGE